MFGGDGVKKEGESSDAPAPQIQPEEEMTIPVVEESAVQSAPGGSNLFSSANQIEDEADESEDEDKVTFYNDPLFVKTISRRNYDVEFFQRTLTASKNTS